MKKLLLLALILLSIFLGYSLAMPNFLEKGREVLEVNNQKKPMLRVALVADSHNENGLLAKALKQAQGKGINFVIGLGDYTNLGTVEELTAVKQEFEKSKLEYVLTAGDRDGWESRRRVDVNYFEEIFGESSRVLEREQVQFVVLDNSDIYKGISEEDWQLLQSALSLGYSLTCSSTQASCGPSAKLRTSDTLGPSIGSGPRLGLTRSIESSPRTREDSTTPRLTFVFAHKTPFHPESRHVMGEDSAQVARQAQDLLKLLQESNVNGFFSGDLHFFAKFSTKGGSTAGGKLSDQSVKITTIGAVASERNFQGPRFGILTVYEDYSWEVEDVEIR